MLKTDFPVELQIEATLCQLEFLNRVLQERGNGLKDEHKGTYLKKIDQLEQHMYQLRIRKTLDLMSSI